MREAYHEQLDSIFTDLAEMARLVKAQVHHASAALLSGDAAIAEEVISGDKEIDRLAEAVEERSLLILSLQQPVAGDLRTVVAALRMVSEVERMGDLSVHVAKIARLRVPEIAVPTTARPLMIRMANVAEEMVSRVVRVISERDVEAAEELALMDDEMDELRVMTFQQLLTHEWDHGVASAIDLALLGRYYERIADHAVSAANRVVFVVTGEHPASI